MKMIQKLLLEATPAEIKLFATNFLGLDLEADDNDVTIYAKVEAAHPSETIFVPEDAETFAQADMIGLPPQRPAGAREPSPNSSDGDRMAGSFGRDDPKVTLTINNEDRGGEVYSRDVPVGVNGVVWLLQRNKPITVPYRVFAALELAVRDSITMDGQTGEVHHTAVRTVPYNVIDGPTRAEVAEWMARQDANGASVNNTFCP